MKTTQFISTVAGSLFVLLTLSLFLAHAQPLRTRVLQHAGKTFTGLEDPGFKAYDQALRAYVSERIQKKYGIGVDTKKYSGFELLEIEAFLKCKKSTEALDPFLSSFRTR